MAFIDWLKKQHADSLVASQRMAADPFLRGIKPGAMNFPAAPERMGRPGSASRGKSLGGLTAQGVLPFQKTKPGFFARDYKKEDLVDNTLTIKNDGSETLVKKWKDPDRHQLILGPVEISKRIPWGPNMGQSYPGASYGGALRGTGGLQPRVSDPMNTRPGTVGGSLHHPASIANMGMPDISNQRAMYHALRRPHPQVAGTRSMPQQTQQNILGSRFAPNPASLMNDEWRFLLERIHGGNY
jgi:hypothetical protein